MATHLRMQQVPAEIVQPARSIHRAEPDGRVMSQREREDRGQIPQFGGIRPRRWDLVIERMLSSPTKCNTQCMKRKGRWLEVPMLAPAQTEE